MCPRASAYSSQPRMRVISSPRRLSRFDTDAAASSASVYTCPASLRTSVRLSKAALRSSCWRRRGARLVARVAAVLAMHHAQLDRRVLDHARHLLAQRGAPPVLAAASADDTRGRPAQGEVDTDALADAAPAGQAARPGRVLAAMPTSAPARRRQWPARDRAPSHPTRPIAARRRGGLRRRACGRSTTRSGRRRPGRATLAAAAPAAGATAPAPRRAAAPPWRARPCAPARPTADGTCARSATRTSRRGVLRPLASPAHQRRQRAHIVLQVAGSHADLRALGSRSQARPHRQVAEVAVHAGQHQPRTMRYRSAGTPTRAPLRC